MKSRRWIWIPLNALLAIHDAQVAEHGGLGGIRDLAAIDSALARPRNLVAYGKLDAARLAAAYALGLAGNHGFLDGNKRTAYVVAETFLDLNGFAMDAPDEAVIDTMLAVASGAMTEEELVKWFRKFLR